jgi:hypothetical protein
VPTFLPKGMDALDPGSINGLVGRPTPILREPWKRWGRKRRSPSVVVQRFGGTVDKFTEIMAVFGAPGAMRITRSAVVLRRWAFKGRPPDWPLKSKTATGSTFGCAWD